MKEKLNKEIVQKALDDCDGNISLAAKKLNSKYVTIHWWVKRKGVIAKRTGIKLSKEKIQELYNEHQSLRKVAKILGCTAEGLRMFMHRENLDVNELIFCNVDHDFFSKDNERSFYWAGFLAADGCVVDGKSVKNRNIISLGISRKDLAHLEQYKNDLQSEHKIYLGLTKDMFIIEAGGNGLITKIYDYLYTDANKMFFGKQP